MKLVVTDGPTNMTTYRAAIAAKNGEELTEKKTPPHTIKDSMGYKYYKDN